VAFVSRSPEDQVKRIAGSPGLQFPRSVLALGVIAMVIPLFGDRSRPAGACVRICEMRIRRAPHFAA